MTFQPRWSGGSRPPWTPGSPVSAALWNIVEGQIREVLRGMTVADVRLLGGLEPTSERPRVDYS
jgi:hypothetical protein